jgi:dsRNA-specific ribonuclease
MYGVNSEIHNMNLYKRAFIHRSYLRRPHLENESNNIKIVEKPDDCLPLYSKSNERLEFIGDGVLECITKYYLYRRFPKENEGFMTEKKIALVKNEAIGKLAIEMGLHKWVILSKHAESKHIRTNLKKLGCLFEAFIGAMFLDFNKISVNDDDGWFQNVFVTGPGFQIAQKFVENIFEKHIDWIALIQNDDNYKNILQVKIQKEFKKTCCLP